MYSSVQDRANRLQMHGFSDKDSCPPWVFKGHPLNLEMGPSGDEYGNPMNLDWNSGNSWAGCGKIYWDLLWGRDYLYMGWVRVRSRDDWWCVYKGLHIAGDLRWIKLRLF